MRSTNCLYEQPKFNIKEKKLIWNPYIHCGIILIISSLSIFHSYSKILPQKIGKYHLCLINLYFGKKDVILIIVCSIIIFVLSLTIFAIILFRLRIINGIKYSIKQKGNICEDRIKEKKRQLMIATRFTSIVTIFLIHVAVILTFFFIILQSKKTGTDKLKQIFLLEIGTIPMYFNYIKSYIVLLFLKEFRLMIKEFYLK
ncbi:hypothetical protein SNEBB_009049 [Seison nebaliae]|nr:hypothetical protein SNEBB_009049 [Seison nebaliae]